MTAQQQAHNMIDNLNLDGLNYIIGVLNGLGADNWVNVSAKSDYVTKRRNEKRKAFQELEAWRKECSKMELSDFDEARMEGLMSKWGGSGESAD